MKKLIPFLLLLIIAISSCKKCYQCSYVAYTCTVDGGYYSANLSEAVLQGFDTRCVHLGGSWVLTSPYKVSYCNGDPNYSNASSSSYCHQKIESSLWKRFNPSPCRISESSNAKKHIRKIRLVIGFGNLSFLFLLCIAQYCVCKKTDFNIIKISRFTAWWDRGTGNAVRNKPAFGQTQCWAHGSLFY